MQTWSAVAYPHIRCPRRHCRKRVQTNGYGPGVTVNQVDYRMSSVDAGLKYKGLAIEAEAYWRWLRNFEGVNTAGVPNVNDSGYQIQTSAMAVPKILQVYLSGSQIFGGRYGDDSEVRGGANWFVMKERGLRLNGTQPEPADEHVVEIKLPLGYPREKPLCTAVTAVASRPASIRG